MTHYQQIKASEKSEAFFAMKPKKKRTKAFRPRACPPALVYRALGEMTDEDQRDLIIHYRSPLKALLSGAQVNQEIWAIRRTALSLGYYMAEDFEQKVEIQLAILLGLAAYDFATLQCADERIPEKCLTDTVLYAFDFIDEMVLNGHRDEFARAIYKADDVHIDYHQKDAMVARPENPTTWRHSLDLQGMTFIHGRPMIGCLEFDEHQRLVWSMPLEERRIVCDEPFVLIKTKFHKTGSDE